MGDNKSAQQPDVNEQIKVRMEKLKNLQDAGKDPFQITKYDVTHHTDEIRAIYEAHEKELLGDRQEKQSMPITMREEPLWTLLQLM